MKREQYVCLVCGFNIVGSYPPLCPFCGADRKHFITAEDCSARYKVEATAVNERVKRLNSVPVLGLEHAAYHIDTGDGICWIDCPSSFDPSLDRTDLIFFTHHHFLGAVNLYRDNFPSWVCIHQGDSMHDLCRPFTFDATFEHDFNYQGIEAFHVDGHTPGFTFYIFDGILFICDYVFLEGDGMKYNPYGPGDRTVAGGERIRKVLEERELDTVCGYNYVMEYPEWKKRFDSELIYTGY
jgi:glyoxylase-like metal-dependent hydrolase (beta-lactamase superfamily II)